MSTSSTLRCISRLVPVPPPPQVVSPLGTVRLHRARTESPARSTARYRSQGTGTDESAWMTSSAYSASTSASLCTSTAANLMLMSQSVYAPSETERREVEERWARNELDKSR